MAEKAYNLDDAVRGLRDNTVKTIDLSWNDPIGDPGATALAEAVKHNKSVKEIDLSYNSIGDPGATALAEAVKHNKSVEWIGLFSNKIGDPGATALAEAVKHNKSVKTIFLRNNSISPKVLEAVQDAIKHIPPPFFLLELDCTNLRAADVPAFHFVRFVLFLGAGIGTKYDEAQEDEVGVLLDPLPSEVWLLILSFLRLSDLQFAVMPRA